MAAYPGSAPEALDMADCGGRCRLYTAGGAQTLAGKRQRDGRVIPPACGLLGFVLRVGQHKAAVYDKRLAGGISGILRAEPAHQAGCGLAGPAEYSA